MLVVYPEWHAPSCLSYLVAIVLTSGMLVVLGCARCTRTLPASSLPKYSLSVLRQWDAAPSTPIARPSCSSISPSARRTGHALALADPSGGVLGWAVRIRP